MKQQRHLAGGTSALGAMTHCEHPGCTPGPRALCTCGTSAAFAMASVTSAMTSVTFAMTLVTFDMSSVIFTMALVTSAMTLVTLVMMITTQQRWLKLEKKEPDVFIRGQRLEVVEWEKLLGLQLDHFLTWSTHIKRVHGIVSGYLALLQCIKDCLPRQTRLTFYNCYMLPHLDYCITIWGNTSSVIWLYRLQKRAARIITDSKYLAPSALMLKQLDWLPLPQCVQYCQVQLVYRAVNWLAPDYICSMFHPVSEVSSGATRASVRGGSCVRLWGALASLVTWWRMLGQSSGTI